MKAICHGTRSCSIKLVMIISVSKGVVTFFAMKYLVLFLLVDVFCSELNATEFLKNKTEGN